MATLTICDGCETPVRDGEATTVGRYDPVVYCAGCVRAWRDYETAAASLHASIVAKYEAGLAALQAALKHPGEGRRGLTRVPDEE